ncbi:hypothetical protein A0H81_14750 [Grifola frondosa]|uniref:Uncharacterized protein n=1 Tax=Grifola frondosa TaxID=5627 RepID=A0A1C7LKR4_GRIFR|nr:hypothetical protein A0H81_14750 [Grifola frondosa]
MEKARLITREGADTYVSPEPQPPGDFEQYICRDSLFHRLSHALPPGPQCSQKVAAIEVQGSLSVGSSVGDFRFECADEQGVVLILKRGVKRENLTS